MTIAFVHENKAILPEITAYTNFFETYGIKCETVTPQNISDLSCETEWWFMGLHTNRKFRNRILIHEYASASTPPLANLKDLVKKNLSCRPDFRIYNNKYIEHKLGFTDKIPSGIRDYGIPSQVIQPGANQAKRFDFIYVGTVDKRRQPEILLDCFTENKLKSQSILVLSRNYSQLAKKYSAYSNIHFEGPVAQLEVYDYIRQAKYGINFMPDLAPYNKQTSAKLIDYCACGIPTITSDYAWVREFEKNYGASFFYLDQDLTNFNWTNLNQHTYKIPSMESWTWEKQIRLSGVLLFLQSKFPTIQF